MHINIPEASLSIDQEQLMAIHKKYFHVANKRYLSKKTFQSLLGKLHMHTCVVPARTFNNRMLELFRKKKIHLSTSFFQDVEWFKKFLPHFNGTTIFRKPYIPESESAPRCLSFKYGCHMTK